MSKRFERNQKRRAREAIAEASAAAERYRVAWNRESQLLAHVTRRKEALERAFDDILEMLPVGSSLLPPETIAVHPHADPLDPIMLEVRERFRFGWKDSYQSSPRVERVHALVASIEEDRLQDFGVHAMVDFGGQRYAYAISDKALRHVPKQRLTELIRETIAKQLALLIVSKVRGN